MIHKNPFLLVYEQRRDFMTGNAYHIMWAKAKGSME